MPRTRRRFLAVAGALTLAGCTGGDGGDGDGSTSTPASNDGDGSTNGGSDGDGSDSDGSSDGSGDSTADGTGSDESGTDESAPTVQVRSHEEYGDVLVDAEGMTLYMFDSDTKGEPESTCYDGCAQAWPPLTVDGEPTSGNGVTAELTTFERDDGSMQVAAAGWPLYYYASDQSPGDAVGQGVQDVWWVLAPDGTPKRPNEMTTETSSDTEGGGTSY